MEFIKNTLEGILMIVMILMVFVGAIIFLASHLFAVCIVLGLMKDGYSVWFYLSFLVLLVGWGAIIGNSNK
jgi:hypothetical protein